MSGDTTKPATANGNGNGKKPKGKFDDPVFGELFLVLLPLGILAVLIILNLERHPIREILESPEWSFAAVVLIGQATVKSRRREQSGGAFFMLLVSLTILAVLVNGEALGRDADHTLKLNESPWVVIAQLVMCLIGSWALLKSARLKL
jgi:hypothetical protein